NSDVSLRRRRLLVLLSRTCLIRRKDGRRFSLSLGERAGVRANLYRKRQRRIEFLARPHPYPLPQGEGIAFGHLFDNSDVSLRRRRLLVLLSRTCLIRRK